MAVSFRQAGKLIEYTAVADTEYHVPVAVGSLIGITRKSAVTGEKRFYISPCKPRYGGLR